MFLELYRLSRNTNVSSTHVSHETFQRGGLRQARYYIIIHYLLFFFFLFQLETEQKIGKTENKIHLAKLENELIRLYQDLYGYTVIY